MILIAGIPSEPPVARAIEAAEERGIGHVVFDQRLHQASEMELSLEPSTGWRGRLNCPAGEIDLAALSGVYVRLMDERFLPDVASTPSDSRERARSARFHTVFHEWLNVAPIRIANRPRAMLSNVSKTYQSTVIRRSGFAIPETVVTNDPDRALAFVDHCAAQGDEVIYKSVSGVRSIVQTFSDADRARIGRIRWCPTQFQRKVRGRDVRVHVIGRQTYATMIESAATDYRYAQSQSGSDAVLKAIELPTAMANACIDLAHALGLPFAGIDLRLPEDEEAVCFEVNPSPAYSYYESHTGAPIADALVRWLVAAERLV
jgi:glutathione synthase/RimK-type ligase-like ATP-grasp enzyme